MCYNELRNNKNTIKKNFKNEVSLLEKFKIKFNNNIKDELDYIMLVLSSFLVKSFTDNTHTNYNESFININLYESDNIINNTINDYESFKIWLDICYNKNIINREIKDFNKKNARIGIFKFINILATKEIIDIKTKWIGKKSLNFYILNFEKKNYIYIELHKKKFNIFQNKKNIYIYINHYSNVFKILRENVYSGKSIDFETNSEFFKKILDISAYIDFDLLEYYFNKKIKKLKYDKEKLYDYYNEILNESKKSIKNENIEVLKDLSQKGAEIIDLIRISEILKSDRDALYYFPVILCFRGRTYYTSSISFTFYKEIRYCLHKGLYNENEICETHPLNIEINEIIDKHIYKINSIEKYKFENENIENQRSIIWILISIAEITKKKLGSKISIDKFIEKGINILNNQNDIDDLDEYDDLKLKSLIKTIEEMSNKIYIKRLISKDATASVFQHLIKTLGNETDEALMWCNLKSKEYWYDTYEFILNKWKEKEKLENNELIKKYFNRKSIKKTIMTIQYGAKSNTCWKYFKENFDMIENEENIKENFNKFYLFLNENIGLLKNNTKEILNKLDKIDNIIYLSDGFTVDLKYYKRKKGQVKIMINKSRKTKSEVILLNEIDHSKIKSSSRANYIHALDSAVVRYVVSIKPILTVHDCFLIDPRNVTFLISLVNEAMRKKFHDLNINKNLNTNEIFSIFILI